MGCKISTRRRKNLGYEESLLLASETSFTINEVDALYVLYRKLSSSIVDDGLINKDEFQLALLGSRQKRNLFVDRVFNLFDPERNGVIRFEDFVRSLSIFHPRTPEAEKLEFTFNLYDLRNTGYIEREELKEMLLAVLEEMDMTLTDNLVEAILDKTFSEADIKRDGKIDQEEWNAFVARNPSLMKHMTLPYLKELTTTFPSFMLSTKANDSDLSARESDYKSDSSKSFCRHQVYQPSAYLIFSTAES